MRALYTGRADISACGSYRWTLERDLARTGPVLAGIMVNPSTADSIDNDQTISKWTGFAERLGASRFLIGNKFAWRAKDVRALRGAADPVGEWNDMHLAEILRQADQIIVAWGSLSKLPKPLQSRWREVLAIAQRVGKPLWCWGTTRDGQPLHPLRLAYDTPLRPWEPPLV